MNVGDLIPTARRPAASPTQDEQTAPRMATGEQFADMLGEFAPGPDVVPVEAEVTPIPETTTEAESAPAAPTLAQPLPLDPASLPVIAAYGSTSAPIADAEPDESLPTHATPVPKPRLPQGASATPVPAHSPVEGKASEARPRAEADLSAAAPDERPSPVPAVPTAAAPGPATATATAAPAASAQTPQLVAIDGVGLSWRLEASGADAPTLRATSQAAAPAAPRPVGQQIAAAVTQAATGQVEIRLDPPELGRVQIRLEPVEGGTQAVILAERAETQDLLRRNAGELARELAEAGFGRVSLDFSAGGEAPKRDDRPPAGATAPVVLALAETLPAARARAGITAAGLDIRI